LRAPVDQVVVARVGDRLVRAGLVHAVDPAARLHVGDLMSFQRAQRMVVDAPRPAILVVDRYPGVRADRVLAERWMIVYHGMRYCVMRQ